MEDKYCDHGMVRAYCADCRPAPEGLPSWVTVVKNGRLMHRNEECEVFVNARRDAANPSTPFHIRPDEALVTGYEACYVCFPGIGVYSTYAEW